jgi:hypothetical protein
MLKEGVILFELPRNTNATEMEDKRQKTKDKG